jgi:hypothetical protein
LIPGGIGSHNTVPKTADLYDPISGTFSLAGSLNLTRTGHAAALLSDGTVLIVGGSYETPAEIYETPTPLAPYSLQITPATANMLVGGTQNFTAVDNHGLPRLDVGWTVSDPNLASVTTDEDNKATLTALAAGQVTLTANAEGTTAQEQVTILATGSYPPGTPVWSAPAVAGFSPLQIAQAVPTADGPDLYSVQISNDGTQSVLQALTAQGQQLWQTTLPAPLNRNSVPDGVGGLIVEEWDTCLPQQANPLTVVDLDPILGQPTWSIQAAGIQQGNGVAYCYGHGNDAPQIAVRGDGVVIVSEPTNNGFPPLTAVGPGGQFAYPIPTSSDTENGITIFPQCCMGPPMVNTDGTAYVEYEVRDIVNQIITSDTLYLFQINPDNSFGSKVLSSTTQNQALLGRPDEGVRAYVGAGSGTHRSFLRPLSGASRESTEILRWGTFALRRFRCLRMTAWQFRMTMLQFHFENSAFFAQPGLVDWTF